MSWRIPPGTPQPRPFQGPVGRTPPPRVSLRLGDESKSDLPRVEKWEWPEECRLGPLEMSIVKGTHREGEVPCFGCPLRPGCEVRQDENLRATAEVMGVALADLVVGGGRYRKCECGSHMMEWRANTTAWAREWHCRSEVSRRVFTDKGTTDTVVDICSCVHTEPARGPKRGAGGLHSGGAL